jgi:hypothetical protein
VKFFSSNECFFVSYLLPRICMALVYVVTKTQVKSVRHVTPGGSPGVSSYCAASTPTLHRKFESGVLDFGSYLGKSPQVSACSRPPLPPLLLMCGRNGPPSACAGPGQPRVRIDPTFLHHLRQGKISYWPMVLLLVVSMLEPHCFVGRTPSFSSSHIPSRNRLSPPNRSDLSLHLLCSFGCPPSRHWSTAS